MDSPSARASSQNALVTQAPPFPPADTQQRVCVSCLKRKIKCEKRIPCGSCERLGVKCVSRGPGRRSALARPSSAADGSITAFAEQESRESGELGTGDGPILADEDGGGLVVGIQSLSVPDITPSPTAENEFPSASLIKSGKGKSRGLNSSNMETEVTKTLQGSSKMQHENLQEEIPDSTMSRSPGLGGHSLLFGEPSSVTPLTALHPEPFKAFRLWKGFLDNVHPIAKIVHATSLQRHILVGSEDLGNIPADWECLLFAIYAAAVNSMDNGECLTAVGESREILLTRYIKATEQALVRVSFAQSTNLVVLQALTILLLAIRQQYDAQTKWILSGIASRIGLRMGLQLDGATFGIPVFETEMRRRLGWQLLMLDDRFARRAGIVTPVETHIWDTKFPANLNDVYLSLDMIEMPPERDGITEGIYCMISYEFGNFLRGGLSPGGFHGSWQKLISDDLSFVEQESMIFEYADYLEDKFGRHCDPLIPLHVLCTSFITSTLSKMRFSTHHPQQYFKKGIAIPAAERDVIFAAALNTVEHDTYYHSLPSLKRYLWHMDIRVQFDAFIFIVHELQHRTSGPEVDRAWHQIENIYEQHAKLRVNGRNSLFVAIGILTLKAWIAKERALAREGQRPYTDVPIFILSLQVQYGVGDNKNQGINQMYRPSISSSYGADQDILSKNPTAADFDFIDWAHWNSLLDDSDAQNFDCNGQRFFG